MYGRARTKREWKRNAADQHERESSCASVGAPVAIAESAVTVRRSRSRSGARLRDSISHVRTRGPEADLISE